MNRLAMVGLALAVAVSGARAQAPAELKVGDMAPDFSLQASDGKTYKLSQFRGKQAVALACAEDPWLCANPVAVQWWGGQFAPGQVEVDAPVSRLVSAAHTAVHGQAPAVHGVPYGSDQRLLTGLGGVPTVVYGPGDVRQAHAPDESVPVAELVSVTRTLVRVLATAVSSRTGSPWRDRSSPTRPRCGRT